MTAKLYINVLDWMPGRVTSRDDFMEKVGLVQVSQLGKFPLSDIVHHKDIFQLPRSMSDVLGVWLQKLQVHKRVTSISNKGNEH